MGLNLVRKVREVLAAFIAPKSTALIVQQAPVTGIWSQIVGQDSSLVRGYHHRCICGQRRTYDQNERDVTAIHKCHCGADFNLLRSLDAAPSELAFRLSNLTIKPFSTTPSQPRFVAVGDRDVRDPWSGTVDRRRDEAFGRSDPGMIGPGF
jgi:hypothetical protein